MKTLTIVIKIILVVLFGLAAFDFTYSYYQIVRVFGMFGLLYLAHTSYRIKQKTLMIVFIVFAIIFNPFPAFKIYFSKDVWRILDIIVSLTLIYSLFLKSRTNENSN